MKPETPSPLEQALEALWRRSRFTSYFFQTVQCRREDAIPTLALTVEGSRAILLYNTTFIASLGGEELIGLLVHEMLHVVLSHNHRAFPEEDLRLQNIAQDMTVNSYIIGSSGRLFFEARRLRGVGAATDSAARPPPGARRVLPRHRDRRTRPGRRCTAG